MDFYQILKIDMLLDVKSKKQFGTNWYRTINRNTISDLVYCNLCQKYLDFTVMSFWDAALNQHRLEHLKEMGLLSFM